MNVGFLSCMSCRRRKIGELLEDGQQLRPKHAGAIINRYVLCTVQQVGAKYCVHNTFARNYVRHYISTVLEFRLTEGQTPQHVDASGARKWSPNSVRVIADYYW